MLKFAKTVLRAVRHKPLIRSVFSALAVVGALAGAAASAPAVAGAGEPPRILAYGDSLVSGYGLPAEDAFPAQLERALAAAGCDVEVVNAGNSGDTTAAAVSRLDWVLSEEVDAAIVVFGGNDGLRGLDPKESYKNLDKVLTRFEAEGIPVLLAGMKAPRNLGDDYAAEFDAVFTRLAEAHDVIFYPFFLEGVAARPSLNQPDGIHPNAAGVAVIAENILPKTRELVRNAVRHGTACRP